MLILIQDPTIATNYYGKIQIQNDTIISDTLYVSGKSINDQIVLNGINSKIIDDTIVDFQVELILYPGSLCIYKIKQDSIILERGSFYPEILPVVLSKR